MPEVVDAEYQVVGARKEPAPKIDWGLSYLTIGLILGALISAVVFIGGWIYCVATYGFLLGGSLGWIPSGIAASIAGAIIRYLWGPILLIGGIAFARANAHSQSDSAAAPAPYVSVEAPAPTTVSPAAEVTLPTALPQGPPPPNQASVDKAVSDFTRDYASGGMAAAVRDTMSCYAKLSAASTWSNWDYCAALDRMGQTTSGRAAQQFGWGAGTEYFADDSVSRRQSTAAAAIQNDYSGNRDRVSALKTIVDQTIATRALQEAAAERAVAAEAPATDAATPTQTVAPSFDCAKAISATLKLVCTTPALAQADQDMALAYREALSKTSSPATLRASQLDWIRRRNKSSANATSLSALYAERTSALHSMSGSAP